MIRPFAWVPLGLLLISCAASKSPAPAEDATLSQDAQAARLALSLDRPREAVMQYRRALARARASDDRAAIGDYGYDLAVAQLAANDPRGALASARETAADLERRGVAPFPGLSLVEATALYRIGATREADQLAALAERGGSQAVGARATFLRGLIGDEAGDLGALRSATARLAHPVSQEQLADYDELAARLDRREGRNAQAASAAQAAADIRRATLDYRDMARALAVAASATERIGNFPAAADLYLRAGESAAARGDAKAARSWLGAALRLGRDPALIRQARQTLGALPGSRASGG